jgi:thiosulfate/3-mercaptopyruvate sulfurtransferase|tara:strand:- start:175 stop:993 length:819 start_codon:yes stop_codon:yes gene_type:complete
MSLVSTKWLNENLNNVKIIDASWHMPQTNRNAHEEYKNEHIINSVFFDIDNFSNQKTDLPHMLPEEKDWEKIISNLGIDNKDKVIVYDNSDVISACRCWYSFIFFGHNPNLISILDGGLIKWKKENRPTGNKVTNYSKKKYKSKKNINLVKTKKEIDKNILEKNFKIVDARSKNRFLGLEKEPRPMLRSGSIENSYCLPFNKLINSNDKTFINKKIIREKFNEIGIINENNVVFSCGSGITATVLSLAYSLINDKYLPIIYDGSWAEYGKIK